MMKRMILFSVLSLCCFSISAMNMYTSMCNEIVSLGKSIDQTDVPLIGNISHVLPCAMISAGMQKCPGQVITVCMGLLFYILSRNRSVRAQFNSYKDMILTRLGIHSSRDKQFDDTLFIFDGDDEEDAEEIIELEDELLLEASEDDEYTDIFKYQRSVNNKKRNVKFL
jgi:hypothetical protein